MDPLKTNALPRVDIADFIKSDRGVRSYEDLQGDTVNVYEAISTASFLTITGSPSLGSERTLTLTGDLDATDGGPNALYTLGLSNTTVVPGTYGSLSKIAGFTVDTKGRLTSVTEYALNSDNVTEGVTNLFFTVARARASVSASSPLSYNSGTGVFSLTGTVPIANGGTGAATAALARTALGLAIGTDVQAFNSNLSAYASGDTPSAFTLGIVDSSDAAAWRAAIGASSTVGTVTSVSASGGTTGLTFSGSPITTSGTFTLSGTLAVANGGTGVTTSTGSGANVQATQPQFTNTIGVGAAASASGSGISFPATQAASTDPNTLDDYEEGTYTPTVSAASGSLTTYTASGTYTKIGRQVTVNITISITNNGTGAVALIVSVPFTSGATYYAVGGGTEIAVGAALNWFVGPAATAGTVRTTGYTYPGSTGANILLSMTYFV